MIAMAMMILATVGISRPRVARPYTIATTMNSTEIIAVRWFARLEASVAFAKFTAKVLATIEANAATTRTRVR